MEVSAYFKNNSNHLFAGTQSQVCWCHFSTLKFTSSATSLWIIMAGTFNYFSDFQVFKNCSKDPQIPFLILVKWLRCSGYLLLKYTYPNPASSELICFHTFLIWALLK